MSDASSNPSADIPCPLPIPETAPQRKNPGGRPASYRPEYDQRARDYCLLGATNEDLARLFSVSRDTVQVWLATLESFSDAVKHGREEADARMARALYWRGTGARVKTQKPVTVKDADGGTRVEIVEYVEGYPPDTAAAFIWLKNRRPDLWRDKQDVDITLNGRLGRLPDDERAAKALDLLTRLVSPAAAAVKPGPVIDVDPAPDGADKQE